MSVSCPVCLASRTAFFARGTDWLFETTRDGFDLHSCTLCHCLFISPMPGPDQIAGFYPARYWWDGSRSGLLSRLERIYRQVVLSDHLAFIDRAARHSVGGDGRSARILDVGCGPGTILGLLAERGFQVQGLDASPEASAIARRDYGVDVRVGRLAPDTFDDGEFDTVVLLHTLEHVPDPHRVLSEVGRVMAPGGRLVLQVPNIDSIQCRIFGARWYGLDVPRHLIDYSPRSLTGVLERNGFQVVRTRHFNLRDNAPALASSLVPSLDPVRRAVLSRRPRFAETPTGAWLRHLAYLTVVVASYPAAIAEAVLGRGATLMVEARKAPAE
jgi:2-polyprenyl-3-methyl-5-hydroxy-6-metoxy-1,4-benzoquinol methylase